MVDFTIEKSLANFSPVANFTDNFKANFTENFIAVLDVHKTTNVVGITLHYKHCYCW